MSKLTRRELIQTGLGTLAVGALSLNGTQAHEAIPERFFHHDHVLGTSLDVWIRGADDATVRGIEQVVLDEFERLGRIFSPFDTTSEVSQFNRSEGSFVASSDLLAVLREYEGWGRLTGGACSAQLGGLIRLWSEAQRSGVLPLGTVLEEIVRQIAAPAWSSDAGLVRRTNEQPLDLCSIAKGYALGKAVDAVTRRFPEVTGLLINVGGDLVGAGEWVVGVQNPARPQENARPLTALRLTNRAVATSGGYERGYVVGGRRYSHLLDPRTGYPAEAVAGATVIAPTSVVANALATVLCVLQPAEGLRLIQRVAGAECLLIAPNGEQIRSGGFAAYEVALADDQAKPDDKKDGKATKAAPWLEDHQVTISLEVPKVNAARRYRRPYVAVWIENGDGKPVRTVTVWGNAPRWLPTMSAWWKVADGNNDLVKAVTRATRAPGKYSVVWDGKDDAGKLLSQGTYTVRVEVHREHGKHLYQTGKITCAAEPAKLTLGENEETGETVVEYAKRK